MKQTEEIKAMIREMMAQEMENFKGAVSNGDADETASPVVYTMLQVLMAKIEAMPKVWHSIDEKGTSEGGLNYELNELSEFMSKNGLRL